MRCSVKFMTLTDKSLIIKQLHLQFNITMIIRTKDVSAKRYCRLSTIHTRRVS